LRLEKIFRQMGSKGYSLAQLLCRPENTYATMLNDYPDSVKDYGAEINFQIELNLKYSGYLERQASDIAKLAHIENIKIPKAFDFNSVTGLRNEARQKLGQANPANLGQASRISGVSPADISVLMVALMRYTQKSTACSKEEDAIPPSCC